VENLGRWLTPWLLASASTCTVREDRNVGIDLIGDPASLARIDLDLPEEPPRQRAPNTN
jgi:hypothetical protein